MEKDLACCLSTLLNKKFDDVEKAVCDVLQRGDLVKPTTRVNEFPSDVVAQNVFDFNHFVKSAAEMFQSMQTMMTKIRVIVGHKNQGKSQFLYFLMKVLQQLGEIVVFLDETVLPKEGREGVAISKGHEFAVKFWQESFNENLDACQSPETNKAIGEIKKSLTQFAKNVKPKSFKNFHSTLWQFAQAMLDKRDQGKRVWVLIDEVTKLEESKFPIGMPEEQRESPFNYIVTGSLGIATFIQKKHLGHFVWDLPTFAQEQTGTFARKLSESIKVNLFEALDIPAIKTDDTAGSSASANSADADDNFEAVGARLHSMFGGIPGYIAELLFGLKKGQLLSNYAFELNDRICAIINKSAKSPGLVKDLCRLWLVQMRSHKNNWNCLRDAGLCGTHAPPGIIFSVLLDNLLLCAQYEDKARADIDVIDHFLSEFEGMLDFGTAGNLLELKTITELNNGGSLKCVKLVRNEMAKNWEEEKPQQLLPKLPAIMCSYDEIKGSIFTFANENLGSSWYAVMLPPCFPLVDVLVGCKTPLHIYLVQITNAEDPFAEHFTYETLSNSKSKSRVDALVKVFREHVNSDTQVAPVSFVIHAPRCKDGKQVSPNQTEPYFFSPDDVLKSFGICKARNKRNKDTLKTEEGPTKKAKKSDEEVATKATN
jgi:hypothetical protein